MALNLDRIEADQIFEETCFMNMDIVHREESINMYDFSEQEFYEQ